LINAAHNNGMNSDLKKLTIFQTGYPKRYEGELNKNESMADYMGLDW